MSPPGTCSWGHSLFRREELLQEKGRDQQQRFSASAQNLPSPPAALLPPFASRRGQGTPLHPLPDGTGDVPRTGQAPGAGQAGLGILMLPGDAPTGELERC